MDGLMRVHCHGSWVCSSMGMGMGMGREQAKGRGRISIRSYIIRFGSLHGSCY